MIKLTLQKAITEQYFKNYSKAGFDKKLFPVKDNIRDIVREMLEIGTDKFDDEFVRMIADLDDLIMLNNTETLCSDIALGLIRKIKLAEVRVKNQVNSNLSMQAKMFINTLSTRFDEDSYIVGGFVRDAIANRNSNDVDFCTSIPYDKLQDIFEGLGWETKDTGKQFLVLNISHPDTKENFEVAALRKDKANEGAEVGTIEEDAQRRDFVNSCIYYSIKTKKLIDPSGQAILDCQNNVLRFMGKAKDRIQEDPARVFRGYKMIGRGWEAEPKTLRAMRENFEFAVKNTSSTRIMNEIEKMVGL